jgi:ferredoxin/flavodoxin---NADP+ reductase
MASADTQAQSLRPTVAIVGSGPSGCYTAQFLRKDLPEAEITIFEALPVPYGLVRYGVAADHQGTKAVAAQFERMFTRSGVTFVGNTRIGVDVDVTQIVDSFDVVVVATGLTADRELSIPVDENARVVGSGRILRSLNAFPDDAAAACTPPSQSLGRDLVVVGHGNVAIDVVRLLVKQTHQFSGSDIHDAALRTLRPELPRAVHVIGRSSAENAKFDLAMLRELCTLETVCVSARGLDESASPVADVLRDAAGSAEVTTRPVNPDSATTTSVTFHFKTVPAAVRVEHGQTVLDVTDPAGSPASYSADTVITAIGFCHDDNVEPALAPGAWAAPHVYRVGWFERGGRGNIAENRKHAQQTAKSIVSDLRDGRLRHGHTPGLAAVDTQLHDRVVDFAGWLTIDAAEREAGDENRCRRKITDLDEMVALAHSTQPLGDHA